VRLNGRNPFPRFRADSAIAIPVSIASCDTAELVFAIMLDPNRETHPADPCAGSSGPAFRTHAPYTGVSARYATIHRLCHVLVHSRPVIVWHIDRCTHDFEKNSAVAGASFVEATFGSLEVSVSRTHGASRKGTQREQSRMRRGLGGSRFRLVPPEPWTFAASPLVPGRSTGNRSTLHPVAHGF
jgi:hypothetical protein